MNAVKRRLFFDLELTRLFLGLFFEEVFPGKYAIFDEAGFVGFGDVVIYNFQPFKERDVAQIYQFYLSFLFQTYKYSNKTEAIITVLLFHAISKTK